MRLKYNMKKGIPCAKWLLLGDVEKRMKIVSISCPKYCKFNGALKQFVPMACSGRGT